MNDSFTFSIKELKNKELYIEGSMGENPKAIYLMKSSIPWIITTLRTMTIEDYNQETQKKQLFPEYLLKLRFNIIERGYSWLDIFPCWDDDKKFSLIEIPYLSFNENLLMGEFIEPFLTALEQYIPEEERANLPKPWSQNMTRAQWEEYRRKKQPTKETSKITFVKEIDPRDYFK